MSDITGDFTEKMDRYGSEGIPFLFIADFDLKNPEIFKLDEVPGEILFKTPLISRTGINTCRRTSLYIEKNPVSFDVYLRAFSNVMKNILSGKSYLLNLTFPTEIKTDLTLKEIFDLSYAKYKLLYYNEFVVFSPETFVTISNDEIRSFPMKGTIDSSVINARETLMSDSKEIAEHNTIVDLIRNDMSLFATNVKVERFRFTEEIKRSTGSLLQVSSEIRGRVKRQYSGHLGRILTGMLPAGSVTGAPKAQTVKIIKESENYDRGWYTGVFGVFDGKNFDSAVMIRFIENRDGRMLFKSGGGITSMSDPEKEYNELIAKIYVPAG